MTNSNRIKLTWISFLSYALTGALVIVTGDGDGKYRRLFSSARFQHE
ncbi:TsgA protein -like protein [Salmonella enterica subsp. enterica]|nr:TsgA protein -like protein [Salmonella enterica subsp. enterica]